MPTLPGQGDGQIVEQFYGLRGKRESLPEVFLRREVIAQLQGLRSLRDPSVERLAEGGGCCGGLLGAGWNREAWSQGSEGDLHEVGLRGPRFSSGWPATRPPFLCAH